MKWVLIESALGILFVFLGIFLIYHYLTNVETTSNPWLLFGSVLCTVIGVYCLYRGGKSDVTVNFKKENNTSTVKNQSPTPGFGNILQKNNDLLNQWNKTMAK